jgi:DNA invertase Pin-like site-specific DNA recombinase
MDTAEILADLYLRLSDARLEEALDGREARLRAQAADLGWTVYRVIVENDMVPGNGNGVLRPASAFKRRKIRTPSGRVELRTIRPGFRSLLDDLTTGPVRAVLAEDLDRLLRQPRDGEDLLDAVELSGATCRSRSGSLTLTAGGTDAERFTARIMAATANKASADTARRVRDKKEQLCGQSWQGGRRPFGYRHDPDAPKYHKRLILDDTEAAIIRQAAADILDRDVSLKAIARDLRARGVPTVSGCAWTASTLKDVLVKPMAAGLSAWHGELREAPWPPILERDVWERLKDKLTAPERRTNAHTGNEPKWLVSKFARCGACGGTLHVTAGGKRASAYSGDECNHVARNAAHVDAYIAAIVVERLSRPDTADLLKPPPRPGVDAAALRIEARKLRDRKHSQMRMHAAGAIDDDDLAAGMREIRGRLTVIDAQLAASDQPDPLEEFRGQPATTVWKSLSLPRQRAVVQALIESITILPTAKGRPAGWRPGQSYFNPETIQIQWGQA